MGASQVLTDSLQRSNGSTVLDGDDIIQRGVAGAERPEGVPRSSPSGMDPVNGSATTNAAEISSPTNHTVEGGASVVARDPTGGGVNLPQLLRQWQAGVEKLAQGYSTALSRDTAGPSGPPHTMLDAATLSPALAARLEAGQQHLSGVRALRTRLIEQLPLLAREVEELTALLAPQEHAVNKATIKSAGPSVLRRSESQPLRLGAKMGGVPSSAMKGVRFQSPPQSLEKAEPRANGMLTPPRHVSSTGTPARPSTGPRPRTRLRTPVGPENGKDEVAPLVPDTPQAQYVPQLSSLTAALSASTPGGAARYPQTPATKTKQEQTQARREHCFFIGWLSSLTLQLLLF